jgi:hypothetical protein
MLPKRAFPSRDQAQAFFEQALAYHRDAVGSNQRPKDTWPPAPKTPAC